MMFLGGVFMLYRQSPVFALIAGCGLPFIIFCVFFFLKKATPLFGLVQKKLDNVGNIMRENVAGARVVKAFAKETYESERFDKANQGIWAANMRVLYLLSYMSPLMNIILNLCVVGVIYVGGITVRSGGGVTPGGIMAAVTYLALILTGISVLGNLSQALTKAAASWKRIREVLSCEPAIFDGSSTDDPLVHGEVELRNVSFTYPGSSSEALSDISFQLRAGETLGIIGETGSGKSTLIKLIDRLYDATSGKVFVDGVDVRDYRLNELRDKIAVVLQGSELFSRSVEENIRWGSNETDPYEIKKAAQLAQADDFICDMDNGYYTAVTEGGHSLSGGQKQRIAISRALLRDAEILILDDATSALDLKTESELFHALNANRPELTKIIIAQRVPTIRNADRIAVMQNGRITAIGSHDELLQGSELYREIYDSQM